MQDKDKKKTLIPRHKNRKIVHENFFFPIKDSQIVNKFSTFNFINIH